MDRAVYCVSLKRGEWMIRLNDKHFGPCASREMAVEVAVSAASKAYARGHQAHVLAQEGNQFRTVWFNGSRRSLAGTIASVDTHIEAAVA
jgi:hypothetical protein